MGKVAVVLTITIAVASLVTGEYIFGRIVLPEMGLSTPQWWTYFWGDLFFLIFLSPFYFILYLVKS
jgi:hypothetical protein